MLFHIKTFIKAFLFLILLSLILLYTVEQPSNDRVWAREYGVIPYVTFDGDLVTIHNIRSNVYRSVSDFDIHYYDETFDINDLETLDFIVAPFHPPSAHTFVSFGLKNGKKLSLSIEARREEGESYNIFKGLVRRYEMIYIFADETDVVKLRTNYRDDGEVYMYPIKISKEKLKDFFLDIANRVDKLESEPEFYNTLTNNCTGELVEHVNKIADPDSRIHFSYRYVLPAYAGELVYDLGFIKDEGDFKDLEQKYRITDIGKSCEYAEDFSLCIRGK